ncbi:MAG TPA: glycosyltransferase family 4 protein [Chryseolinea sp.]|nr:glycosyltransferase family 4 protein [Chryseolinea sp.]
MSVIKTEKQSIVWITADYFVDCDFDPAVFEGLLKVFDIHWIVLLPASNARFSEKDFAGLKRLSGLQIEVRVWRCRARSPRMLLFYESLYKRIRKLKPDLVYFNEVPTNPYILPLYRRIARRKSIVTAHDGKVNASFKLAWISNLVFELAFSAVSFVNMFSASQARIFLENFPRPKVFLIPLGLKNFGPVLKPRRSDAIVFFFFGAIHPTKNVELLIDAACRLYDEGVRGFKVAICGRSDDWERYRQRIRYPEIFECDIRTFPSSELPGVFGENHYMVLPYSRMSQSGALKAAFNYRTPVIVSDLEAFKDEVADGVNGFVFKSEDVADLARVMRERILKHAEEFSLIVKRLDHFVEEHYSKNRMISMYADMFHEVLAT